MLSEPFGFSHEPFRVTPDTRFFFAGSNHKDVALQLFADARGHAGIRLLTGPAGSGKTLLLRWLAENAGYNVPTALVWGALLSFDEILSSLCTQLAVSSGKAGRAQNLGDIEAMAKHYAQHGRCPLLLLDEADGLSDEVLNDLALLADLSLEGEPLLTMVLAAGEDFPERFAQSALGQRPWRDYRLLPLDREQTHAYVRHRLAIAGVEKDDLFTMDVLDRLFTASGGIPSLINGICGRALLLASVKDVPQVTDEVIEEAIRDRVSAEGEFAPERRAPLAQSTEATLRINVTPEALSKANSWHAVDEDGTIPLNVALKNPDKSAPLNMDETSATLPLGFVPEQPAVSAPISKPNGAPQKPIKETREFVFKENDQTQPLFSGPSQQQRLTRRTPASTAGNRWHDRAAIIASVAALLAGIVFFALPTIFPPETANPPPAGVSSKPAQPASAPPNQAPDTALNAAEPGQNTDAIGPTDKDSFEQDRRSAIEQTTSSDSLAQDEQASPGALEQPNNNAVEQNGKVEKAPEPAASSKVARAQFTHGIREREPIDRLGPVIQSVGAEQLYYFTELRNMSGETVTHRWLYEGRVVTEIPFKIQGDIWRVYSRKQLTPATQGNWRVVTVDSKGNVIRSDSFQYVAD